MAKWYREPRSAYVQRRYHEWHPRFAKIPHACSNPKCGTVIWWEPMLSKVKGGYDDCRQWACSRECSEDIN